MSRSFLSYFHSGRCLDLFASLQTWPNDLTKSPQLYEKENHLQRSKLYWKSHHYTQVSKVPIVPKVSKVSKGSKVSQGVKGVPCVHHAILSSCPNVHQPNVTALPPSLSDMCNSTDAITSKNLKSF